jgi:hypothetical protein
VWTKRRRAHDRRRREVWTERRRAIDRRRRELYSRVRGGVHLEEEGCVD